MLIVCVEEINQRRPTSNGNRPQSRRGLKTRVNRTGVEIKQHYAGVVLRRQKHQSNEEDNARTKKAYNPGGVYSR